MMPFFGFIGSLIGLGVWDKWDKTNSKAKYDKYVSIHGDGIKTSRSEQRAVAYRVIVCHDMPNWLEKTHREWYNYAKKELSKRGYTWNPAWDSEMLPKFKIDDEYESLAYIRNPEVRAKLEAKDRFDKPGYDGRLQVDILFNIFWEKSYFYLKDTPAEEMLMDKSIKEIYYIIVNLYNKLYDYTHDNISKESFTEGELVLIEIMLLCDGDSHDVKRYTFEELHEKYATKLGQCLAVNKYYKDKLGCNIIGEPLKWYPFEKLEENLSDEYCPYISKEKVEKMRRDYRDRVGNLTPEERAIYVTIHGSSDNRIPCLSNYEKALGGYKYDKYKLEDKPDYDSLINKYFSNVVGLKERWSGCCNFGAVTHYCFFNNGVIKEKD